VSFRRSIARSLLAVSVLLVAEDHAGAEEEVPQRQATFSWDDKQMLRMSVKYDEIVDTATASKLSGGLPTTIVMTAVVLGSGGRVIARTYQQCRVIFDLWNEIYNVWIWQPGSPEEPDPVVVLQDLKNPLAGVLRRCAETDRFPIVHRSKLVGSGPFYVSAGVEVNPVSPDMLDRIKRWVSRPVGTNVAAPGDALFGSFVGLFVARIGAADRFIQFRTQDFRP
jgi:hypothetical protein